MSPHPPGGPPTVLFETARLLARPFAPGDARALFAIYGDAEAMRWVGDGKPLGLDACERWIEVTRVNYDTRGYGMAALIEHGSGEFVGGCGLVHPGGVAIPEIKYALRRDRWARGLASEVVPAMLRYGFAVLALPAIRATASPHNAASIRVLTKAGMRHVHTVADADGSETATYEVVRASAES